jgi:hypothetical protein
MADWASVGAAAAAGASAVTAAWVASYWQGRGESRRLDREDARAVGERRRQAYLKLLRAGERWWEIFFFVIWNLPVTAEQNRRMASEFVEVFRSFEVGVRDAASDVRLVGSPPAAEAAQRLVSATHAIEIALARRAADPTARDKPFVTVFGGVVGATFGPWFEAFLEVERAIRDESAVGEPLHGHADGKRETAPERSV